MKMQTLSTYSDEAVQSAENLLLTFTKITAPTFPEATQAVLDMSTALGEDLNSSAIRIGKALQDPILGVMALRRVGVNFTDSQKEMLKQLVETGHGMEAQKLILEELALEFGGSAAKQLQTFSGRLAWMKNQVGELQEGLGFGLVNALLIASSGVSQFFAEIQKLSGNLELAQKHLREAFASGNIKNIEKAKEEVKKAQKEIEVANNKMMESIKKQKLQWADLGSTVFFMAKLIAKMVWDAMDLIGKALYSGSSQIWAYATDGINAMKNLGQSFKIVAGAIWKAIHGDIGGAFNDLTAGIFPNTTRVFQRNTEIMGGAFNQFGKDFQTTTDELGKAFEANREGIMGMGDSASGATPAMDNFGEAADAMGGKVEEASKKIKELRSEMKKAIKEAKQEIKDLKKSYAEETKAAELDLRNNIAQVLVDKEEEKKKLTEEYNSAETEEEKAKLKEQITTIDDFFIKHKNDLIAYQSQIKAIKAYAALDEIEKLRKDFIKQQKERDVAYKEELKGLKAHLKEIKKEYHDKIDDIKDELDDLIKKEKQAFSAGVSKGSVKSVAKQPPIYATNFAQFGGSASAGSPILVGEHRPEIFVPSQSGNIRQLGQAGIEKTITVNFNNVSVRSNTDLDEIVNVVRKTLNREQELYQLGAN
jgi:hypothetical protein